MTLADYLRQVLNVLLPGDRSGSRFARPSPTALVVEDEPVAFGESEELRQQVIVVRSRSTVKNEDARSIVRSVFAPVKRN